MFDLLPCAHLLFGFRQGALIQSTDRIDRVIGKERNRKSESERERESLAKRPKYGRGNENIYTKQTFD